MYIIIDNYDSFTYNIFQYMSELTDSPVKVLRNDSVTVKDIRAMQPEGIIISPGPGRPEDAGISLEVVSAFAGEVPIMGVCLGHQVIGAAFGGKVIPAGRIVHGMAEPISHDGKGVFRNLPAVITCTRYHSLAVDRKTLPEILEISASSEDGEIMGIRHREFIVEGVQFHPESISSEDGKRMFLNFINYRRDAFPVKEKLEKIMDGNNLAKEEAALFMEELTDGSLSDIHIAGFLTALNAKGICADEIAGCASVLQKKRVPVKTSGPVLDTCGTGGDGLNTFNISSFAALIAAAGGAVVAKHGNRAVSSKSGSYDFYKELGIPVDITPAQAEQLLGDTGFSFLFAPVYHKAMRFAAPVRKTLKVKTIMNLLGPLVNPAAAEYQIIGVYKEDFCGTVADAAYMLGVKRVMVVHGLDGIDELSVSAPSRVVFIDEEGSRSDYIFDPASVGIKGYSLEDLRGGSAEHNARMAEDLLKERGPEAVKQAVLLNAGAGLYVYGKAGSIAEGYELAKQVFEEGKVQRLIDNLRESV